MDADDLAQREGEGGSGRYLDGRKGLPLARRERDVGFVGLHIVNFDTDYFRQFGITQPIFHFKIDAIVCIFQTAKRIQSFQKHTGDCQSHCSHSLKVDLLGNKCSVVPLAAAGVPTVPLWLVRSDTDQSAKFN
jgi:hypothetical protein